MNFFKHLLPFPKKVRRFQAFLWWLHASFFPYDKGNFFFERKRRWRKYCSECGWPLIRVDDLYDQYYIESIHPKAIQICSFCGMQFERTDRCDIFHGVYPIWELIKEQSDAKD